MVSQFLIFKLDGTQYAVEVYCVQEVLEHTHITKVPCASACADGLINSRGKGISVINLRKKFALPAVSVTKETRIIVLETKTEKGDIVTFGAVADSVQEVIDLSEKEIEPSPKFGNSVAAQYIRGIGKRDDSFIIILDVDHIFSAEEIVHLSGAALPAAV